MVWLQEDFHYEAHFEIYTLYKMWYHKEIIVVAHYFLNCELSMEKIRLNQSVHYYQINYENS